MLQVLCKVLDINTDDVNTTTPMSDFVQKLGQLNSTDKLTGLAGKLGDVCQAIGLNITIDIEILQKGFKGKQGGTAGTAGAACVMLTCSNQPKVVNNCYWLLCGPLKQ